MVPAYKPGNAPGFFIIALVFLLSGIALSASLVRELLPVEPGAMELYGWMRDTLSKRQVTLEGEWFDGYRERVTQNDTLLTRQYAYLWNSSARVLLKQAHQGLLLKFTRAGVNSSFQWNSDDISRLNAWSERSNLEATVWQRAGHVSAAAVLGIPLQEEPSLVTRKDAIATQFMAGCNFPYISLMGHYSVTPMAPWAFSPVLYGRALDYPLFLQNQKLGLLTEGRFRNISIQANAAYTMLTSFGARGREGFSMDVHAPGTEAVLNGEIHIGALTPFFACHVASGLAILESQYGSNPYLLLDTLRHSEGVWEAGLKMNRGIRLGIHGAFFHAISGYGYFEPFPFSSWAQILDVHYRMDRFNADLLEYGLDVRGDMIATHRQTLSGRLAFSSVQLSDTLVYRERKMEFFLFPYYLDPLGSSPFLYNKYWLQPSLDYCLHVFRSDIRLSLSQIIPIEKPLPSSGPSGSSSLPDNRVTTTRGGTRFRASVTRLF
ncbi:MAG: hypothetical protein V1913_12050 [Fibrobacterota bacterium]